MQTCERCLDTTSSTARRRRVFGGGKELDQERRGQEALLNIIKSLQGSEGGDRTAIAWASPPVNAHDPPPVRSAMPTFNTGVNGQNFGRRAASEGTEAAAGAGGERDSRYIALVHMRAAPAGGDIAHSYRDCPLFCEPRMVQFDTDNARGFCPTNALNA